MAEPAVSATVVGSTGQSAEAELDVGSLGRGQTLGRYLIIDELGRGGMGKVYAANDPEFDRTTDKDRRSHRAMRSKWEVTQPDLLTALTMGMEIHRRDGELDQARVAATTARSRFAEQTKAAPHDELGGRVEAWFTR